jgi:O-antigen/teichoic acid export membrane protein
VNAVFLHALIYGLAPILQKLAGVVLLPLYTHYLTPADYGEITLLSIVTSVAVAILQLELRQGFLRGWIAAPDDGARASLFRAVLALLAALGLAGAVVLVVFGNLVVTPLLGHPIGPGFRLLLAAGLFADVTGLVCNATLQARLKSGTVVALGLATFVLSVSVTVICVVHLHSGAIGFFAGGTVSSVAGLAASLVLLRGFIVRAGVSAPPDLRGLLAYSLPLLASALMFMVVRNTDRLAVGHFDTLAVVGVYGMAWTLANLLMNGVFVPLQTSFDVWRFRLYHEGGRADDIARIFRMAMLVVATAGVGLDTVGADLFTLVSDPRYGAATRYLPVLTLAVLLQAGYSLLAAAFFVTGATGQWFRIFAAGAALQVLLSVALVPVFSAWGAAASILSANLLLYAGAARWGARLWPIPYRHGPVMVLLGLVAAASTLRAAWPIRGPLDWLAADAVALAFYGAGVLSFGLVGRGEMVALRRWRRARA